MSTHDYTAEAVELLRRMRQQWVEDFEDMLRAIDPALLNGNLTPRGLPANVLINRGTYSATATYRPGDLVFSDSGTAYVALLGSTGVLLSDTTTWRPLGGGTAPAPFVYLTDADGFYLVDSDGAYLWEYI